MLHFQHSVMSDNWPARVSCPENTPLTIYIPIYRCLVPLLPNSNLSCRFKSLLDTKKLLDVNGGSSVVNGGSSLTSRRELLDDWRESCFAETNRLCEMYKGRLQIHILNPDTPTYHSIAQYLFSTTTTSLALLWRPHTSSLWSLRLPPSSYASSMRPSQAMGILSTTTCGERTLVPVLSVPTLTPSPAKVLHGTPPGPGLVTRQWRVTRTPVWTLIPCLSATFPASNPRQNGAMITPRSTLMWRTISSLPQIATMRLAVVILSLWSGAWLCQTYYFYNPCLS